MISAMNKTQSGVESDGRAIRESLSKEASFNQTAEGKGDEPRDYLEEEHPGTGDSLCRGPEVKHAWPV